MNKDILSILCKVNGRSRKNIEAIEKCLADYCSSNGLEPPQHHLEKNDFSHAMHAFKAEKLDAIATLLNDLQKHSTQAPIAEYMQDNLDDQSYYVVIGDELRKFDSFEEAQNPPPKTSDSNSSSNDSPDHASKTISLIRVSFTKAKRNVILKYFGAHTDLNPADANYDDIAAKYLSAIKKDAINKARYKTSDPKKDWNGQIERILPHVKFMLDQDDSIVIGIDLFNEELLPRYPGKKILSDKIALNKEGNREIQALHQKELKASGLEAHELPPAFDPLSEDEADCKAEMRRAKIEDSAENLLLNIFYIRGVSEAAMVFRHAALGLDRQIDAAGSPSQSLYYCHLNDLTDSADWIENSIF